MHLISNYRMPLKGGFFIACANLRLTTPQGGYSSPLKITELKLCPNWINTATADTAVPPLIEIAFIVVYIGFIQSIC
ncbi:MULTISPECIES: hypothetical protein [Acinetobacter]|uniref:hypothetical protein n=1 Tax=Acinetobacter TaxID=469 RepID=UPI00055771ED|nr:MULTISPECIES: hypothetical protein [Acinetobacter]KKW75241.1 hypothetical protein AAV97_19350 [Acinetobacter sp. Ag2]MBI0393744.1 hypothetical protein [Acinetobacter bereziniae]MBJ8427143.1 hypothetical protein [Acinetobacter bereziniae]MCU4419176.1 hypothetical protein [Acinetobacter bereziniae]